VACVSQESKVAGLVVLAVVLLAVSELGLRIYYYEKFGVDALESQALRDRFTAWRNNPAHAGHNPQGFRRNTRVRCAETTPTLFVYSFSVDLPCMALGELPSDRQQLSLLRDDELIDFYLERKLNHDIPGKHWEVINAASSGYRIHQQLVLIESVILRYQPDLVFAMDGYNDAIAVFNHVRLVTSLTLTSMRLLQMETTSSTRLRALLGGHLKPAIERHLKTGQR
jgi:hypothetical protein